MSPENEAKVMEIKHPDRALWIYYILRCLLFPPLLPILIVPSYFRYHTMRYKFGPEGISMSWGILFRHEIILNYARIQDIHLRSNVVERWLGLARVLIQTASGSSSAEMTIEGIKNFQDVRDFLYSRMRGVKDEHAHGSGLGQAAPGEGAGNLGKPRDAAAETDAGQLVAVLRETAGELRALREVLERAEGRRK